MNLYLLNYRNSPVAGLEYSPSQLLMSRHLRSKLPVKTSHLVPNVIHNSSNITDKTKQEHYYNRNCKKDDDFVVNEPVLVQNKFSKIWEEGKIVKKLKFRSYLVEINGTIYRRNSFFIRKHKRHIEYGMMEGKDGTIDKNNSWKNERPKRDIRKPERLNL